MDEKIRKARFEKYGSFLFCPAKSTLCFGRITDGECKHSTCLLDDPEYQLLQKRIAENQRKNQQREHEEPPKIRRQTKTRIEILEEQIKRKDEEARAAYRANYPKEGDRIINEVICLQGLLRQEKEKNDKRKKDDKKIRENDRRNAEVCRTETGRIAERDHQNDGG